MTKKVLVAESDASTRDMLAVALGTQGHETVEASNGFDAWRLLQERQGIDAIISVLRMFPLSGIDLLDRVRGHSRLEKVPFILVTTGFEDVPGRSGVSLETYCSQMKARLVFKPYDLDWLLESLFKS